jgi:hypothetical protein
VLTGRSKTNPFKSQVISCCLCTWLPMGPVTSLQSPVVSAGSSFVLALARCILRLYPSKVCHTDRWVTLPTDKCKQIVQQSLADFELAVEPVTWTECHQQPARPWTTDARARISCLHNFSDRQLHGGFASYYDSRRSTDRLLRASTRAHVWLPGLRLTLVRESNRPQRASPAIRLASADHFRPGSVTTTRPRLLLDI